MRFHTKSVVKVWILTSLNYATVESYKATLTISADFSRMMDNFVSPLQYLPFLGTLQSKFNCNGAIKWLSDIWHIPVAAICIYLVFIYVGRKWMANREPYNLKRPLFLWNVLLAVLSILGTINSLPSLVKTLLKNGIPYTTCKSGIYWNPHVCTWGFFVCCLKS